MMAGHGQKKSRRRSREEERERERETGKKRPHAETGAVIDARDACGFCRERLLGIINVASHRGPVESRCIASRALKAEH